MIRIAAITLASNSRGKKSTQTLFCTKLFENPSRHGRPRRKSWTSTPESAFFCGSSDGETLFDPGSSGRKGQECLREIRTKKVYAYAVFFFWEATKEYLNHRGTKIRVFRVRFRAPFLPPFFPSFSPALSPSSPIHFPTISPLFTSPCIPPFLTPGKLRFRYPSDLGTL